MVGIDIETYSPIDITKTGVYKYAESDDFQILLIGYRFDDTKSTAMIDLSSLSREEAVSYVKKNHRRLYEALHDEDELKTAFNANFERVCLGKYFGYMPPEQWQCTMIRAASLGLPMSLDQVGQALHLSEDQAKLKTGKELIRYFCKPCKPTKTNGGRVRNLPAHAPEKWELFKQYCARDVDAEQTILSIVNSYGEIFEPEHRLWSWDQRMNDHGVALDVPYIKGILDFSSRQTAELAAEAARLTGLSNPNSVSQLRSWLMEQGIDTPGLAKADVAELMKQDLPAEIRRVLSIRQQLGKTSTKKYQAMETAVCADGRLRGILQFYGANRTGRWAGRIVQVHNLPQNHIDDIEYCRQLVAEQDFQMVEDEYGELASIFSQLVRTAFIPSEGNRFIVSDFSAIEARVLSWLAGEEWRQKVFADGGDIYCASASQMFHVPVEKHGVNGHLRQKGKVAELALGYQGGVGAMKAMDSSGSIPEDEYAGIVRSWRDASPNIVSLWWTMESAAKKAIREARPKSRAVGIKLPNTKIRMYMDDNVLKLVLPSGRELAYWNAEVRTLDDGREHILYSGINQETRKWIQAETYGGKLVENTVQAIARDCLAEALLRVTEAGYRIVMHIHDEMVVDVPREDTEAAKKIDAMMGITPEWASGLILTGDGYETDFYRKD